MFFHNPVKLQNTAFFTAAPSAHRNGQDALRGQIETHLCSLAFHSIIGHSPAKTRKLSLWHLFSDQSIRLIIISISCPTLSDKHGSFPPEKPLSSLFSAFD